MTSFSFARLERFWPSTLSEPVLLAEEPLHDSATTEKPRHPMRAPMRRGQAELPAVFVLTCGKAGECDSPSGRERREM